MLHYDEIHNPEEKVAIAERILRALPDWFGVEESLLDYLRQARELPLYAALHKGEAVGFVLRKPQTPFAQEVCVMGVLEAYHRRGVGRELIRWCEERARQEGATFLTVKTLAEDHPDPGYASTRRFYAALGFLPLEVFPTLWDENNPCLLQCKVL